MASRYRDDEEEEDRPMRKRRSSRHEEEDDEHEEGDDEEEQFTRERFRCKGCGSRRSPVRRDRVSSGGKAVFWVLLIFFFPLCWIGLLMRENWRECSECALRVGRKP